MPTVEATYKVVGMTCQSCAASVQSILEHLPGVQKAEVHFATQEVVVEYEPERVPFEKLQAALAPAGYELLPNAQAQLTAQKAFLRRLRVNILVAGLVAGGGMGLHIVSHTVPTAVSLGFFFLSVGVVLLVGRHFFLPAWQQLRVRQLTMDTLISLGLIGSVTLGVFEVIQGRAGHSTNAATEILFFVLIGRYLEERARYRTQSVLEGLSALAAPMARVRRGGRIEEVPTALIQPGDLVEVQPKSVFPIDGEIVEGYSFIQESLLTGESLPVEKGPGNRVWAGTTNLSHSVLVRAEVSAQETVLAQLITRLQRAQSTRARAQRLADQVSAVFVPVVLLLAGLTVAYHLWGEKEASFAWERALSVLVVSCPCALGLATPLAVQMAIGGAAQGRILLREISQLENLPLGTLWAFDKTGTLTTGQARVQEAHWQAPDYAGRLLYVLGRSQHPLAEALATYLRTFVSPEPTEVLAFVELPGKGIVVTLPDEKLYIGHPAWIATKHPLPQEPTTTAVAVASDRRFIGLFTFSDTLREGLRSFIADLRRSGKEVVLLTGDPSPAGKGVAEALGITRVHAGLSPIEKAEWIETAQRQGHKVVFVGDGINDTLALQAAFVGIAVHRSAGAATQSAGIALLEEVEKALPALYALSLRLRAIIAQNLAWAFGYNLIAIPVAMGLFPGVYLSPGVSALLMSLSSLTVVLNSLRLRLTAGCPPQPPL